MLLDTNGLPLPGRELDVWIWRKLGLSQYGDYSTTHAFFQVMEVMEGDWMFTEYPIRLHCYLHEPLDPITEQGTILGTAIVERNEYPDREPAYAHAVCCCAWKAMGGADGD